MFDCLFITLTTQTHAHTHTHTQAHTHTHRHTHTQKHRHTHTGTHTHTSKHRDTNTHVNSNIMSWQYPKQFKADPVGSVSVLVCYFGVILHCCRARPLTVPPLQAVTTETLLPRTSFISPCSYTALWSRHSPGPIAALGQNTLESHPCLFCSVLACQPV